jgi:hypothetical protein
LSADPGGQKPHAKRTPKGGRVNEMPTSSADDGSMVTTATDRAADVAGTATDQAAEVAGTVKEQVSAVAQEVSAQTQNVLGQAKDTLHDQARARTGEAAKALREWTDQTRALAEGRTEDAGAVGRYAGQASDKLAELARRVDARGFDGLVRDVETFARDKPGVFLFGAGVAGFLVGRMLRGAAASSDASPGGGSSGASATAPVAGPAVWKPEVEPTLAAGAPPLPSSLPRPSAGGL